MIAGLESVSDGAILFDGQPVAHLEPKDRDIAMVFQSYALYPHMTVTRQSRLQPEDEGRVEGASASGCVRTGGEMLGIDGLLAPQAA